MCSDRKILFILNVFLDVSLRTLCVFLIKVNLANPETLLFLTGSIWRHLTLFVVSEKKKKNVNPRLMSEETKIQLIELK